MDALSAFRPHRAVSARSLSRQTAQILDEIYETGHAVAVVRYGRIEAVLAPTEDGPKVGLARSFKARSSIEDEKIDIDALGITSFEREMFERIANSSSGR